MTSVSRRGLFVAGLTGLTGFSGLRGSGEMERAADRFDRADAEVRRLDATLDGPAGTLASRRGRALELERDRAIGELSEAETDLAVLIDPAAREFDQEAHRDSSEAVAAVVGNRLYVVVLDSSYDRPRVHRVAV